MKCRLSEEKNMKVLLIVGVALIALGAAAAWLLPEEAHLATRFAGFVNGAGASLAAIAVAVLLRRRRLGEARAKDSELTMSDERGIAVAYKAQNVAAIAAVLALATMTLTALVRDDTLYMTMGSSLLCAVALVKLVAWYAYNRKM